MGHRRYHFRLAFVAALLLGGTASALAQSGQSIIFSKPADHSATPERNDSKALPGANNSANPLGDSSLFNSPDTSAPLPPPLPSATDRQQLQKNLRDRRDWALMTPEEILGVKRPESILMPEGQPDDKEKDLTPLERYLSRQEQARRQSVAGTNGSGTVNNAALWETLMKSKEAPNDGRMDAVRATTANTQPNWKELFGGPSANNNIPVSGRTADWGKPFGFSPAAPAAEDLAKAAEMERFRKILAGSTPADATAKASPGGQFLLSPPASPIANPQPPVATPAFNSITPVSALNDKPTELTSLKILSGQPVKPATVTRPAWAPQPPPWLSQMPQPLTFTPPPRQF